MAKDVLLFVCASSSHTPTVPCFTVLQRAGTLSVRAGTPVALFYSTAFLPLSVLLTEYRKKRHK